MIEPRYQSERVTLYCADCRDVLPQLTGVDAVVTDPPWGLGELSGTTGKERNRNAYVGMEDTEEYVRQVVIPAIVNALALANGRGLVACGVRCMFLYPRPRAAGGVLSTCHCRHVAVGIRRVQPRTVLWKGPDGWERPDFCNDYSNATRIL